MNVFVPLLYDLVIIAIIVAAVWRSARLGFLRSALYFFSGVIAAAVATFVSNVCSEPIYTMFFQKKITESLENSLSGNGGTLDAGNLSTFLDSLPDSLSALLESFFGTQESLLQIVETASAETADTIAEAAVQPAMESLIGLVLFLVVFSLVLAILRFVARALKIVDHLPVVGKLNSFLGGVFGVLRALLTIILLVSLVQLLIWLSGDELQYLNTELIANTHIFHIFYTLHPLVTTEIGI